MFINAAATSQNTKVNLDAQSFTLSRPAATWAEWRSQKKRHYSTSKYYKRLHKFLLAGYAFAAFLFYPLLVLCFVFVSWESVSYTHLDVYKRQRLEIVVGAPVVLALQDVCPSQAVEIVDQSPDVPESALQDVWRDQPAVLIGFIAQFTGSALQDDIARNTRRLVKLGHDILAGRIGDDDQTSALSGTDQADTNPVQLGLSLIHI